MPMCKNGSEFIRLTCFMSKMGLKQHKCISTLDRSPQFYFAGHIE